MNAGHKSRRLIAHFWTGGIGAPAHQTESDAGFAMRTGRADGVFVEIIELILLQPHQLKALGTGTHLSCHRELPFMPWTRPAVSGLHGHTVI